MRYNRDMDSTEKKLNILIVDDDSFLLDIYSRKFREAGAVVQVALSGEDAVAKTKEGFKPDVVLLDLVMPGMDGVEIIEAFKEGGIINGGITIVLSNQSQQSDIDRAMQAGASGYIVKANVTPSEVLQEVFSIYEGTKKQ
jgi:CheY-like chemotaxis protein